MRGPLKYYHFAHFRHFDIAGPSISFLAPDISSVHKLLGNFSASLGFQLAEQHSVYWATFKFLCFDGHSHAHATSETIKEVQNVVENIFVQYFSFTIS